MNKYVHALPTGTSIEHFTKYSIKGSRKPLERLIGSELTVKNIHLKSSLDYS